jgi:uncharacterized damage-inducible protein DinB
VSSRSKKTRNRMDEITLLRAWSDWNLKSLNDYLKAILQLSPEVREKDRGASWGSIQNIFLHIIEDYFWWFENVRQGRTSDFKEVVGHEISEQELKRYVRRVGRSVHSIMGSLKPSNLGRPILVSGTGGNGKPYTMTTCLPDIIWHMVEEQLQHIGEINALFWQMDIDPPAHAWFSSKLAFTF